MDTKQRIFMSTSLLEKTSRLIESISAVSESIRNREYYNISDRLWHVANSVYPSIEAGYNHCKRSERIRSWIKAVNYLEECRDYLNIVGKFQYADTGHLIEEIDKIKELLRDDYNPANQFISSN